MGTEVLDNMASCLEFLDWDLAFFREDKDVPILKAHLDDWDGGVFLGSWMSGLEELSDWGRRLEFVQKVTAGNGRPLA